MGIVTKIGKWFFSIVLLILSANIILNVWVGIKFKNLLETNLIPQHSISYHNLSISLFDSSYFINEISIDYNNGNDKTVSQIFGKINALEISQIKFWKLLFTKNIDANNVILHSPTITFYKTDSESNNRNKKNRFNKNLTIQTFSVKNAFVKTIDLKSKKVLLEVFNTDLKIENINVTNETIEAKIPFLFDQYTASCDSIAYHRDEFYDFRSSKITLTSNTFNAKDVKMIPLYSRKGFVKRIPLERDLYTVFCPEIEIKNMNWGFRDSVFFFAAKNVVLDKVSANIYRSKMPKDNLFKKNLYNKMLRDLKFNLDIDTLKIRNSTLEYEEEISFEKGAGLLTFENFNLTASNIESGLGKTNTDDMNIKVNCNFMKTSPLAIDWKLNVMDKTDGFRVHGSILNFDLEKINPFSLPYINVKVEGVFDKVLFDFTGNDSSSFGKFAMEYDDFKVTVFKNEKRNRKKNKFLTAVGNLFVKKDSKEKMKNVTVKLDRNQEKSFYNFLWINIAEGLKKILI